MLFTEGAWGLAGCCISTQPEERAYGLLGVRCHSSVEGSEPALYSFLSMASAQFSFLLLIRCSCGGLARMQWQEHVQAHDFVVRLQVKHFLML